MPATRRSRNSSKSPNSDGEDHADEDSDESAAVKHVVLDEFAAPAIRAGVTSASEYRVGINAQKMFLTRAPKNGAQAIRCYVERDRHGLNRLHPVFRLFLEDGKQFLLCAQRRAGSKTANYLLTMERNPTDRRSALIVGKLRGNWSGSEYFIFDDGLSHSKTAIDSNVRSILGVIEFAYDEMGPGKLNVRIPTVQEGGAGSKWKDPDLERGGPQARKVLNDHIRSNSLFLRNKRPQFDAKSGGHVLDFQGRVTMASIKNFQIQCDDLGDSTILQFGRVSCQPPGPRTQCSCHKNLFIMDVKYPLSPLQAFAVCLSTLDSKVADLKLYDNVARLVKKKGA
ncbi:TPA: hypothetical protein N0F65_000494 [Lagenidium giganteum]|uniref:Tubby C-terminal domain-containing protein n=1 Tax=Lagenidium giganteum TaxID=4803 RepID=A0AAV2YV86_9STRA|nr:TPA: hypothetical protein N0F65_000494 [Lagenidium giganteum]